jgi:hypothetical protein
MDYGQWAGECIHIYFDAWNINFSLFTDLK